MADVSKAELAKQSATLVVGAAASTVVAGYNSGRRRIIVTNPGAADAFLAFAVTAGPSASTGPVAPTAVLNSGFHLKAASATVFDENDYIGPIAAFSTAGTTLAITEY